jgi:hypothetical protein
MYNWVRGSGFRMRGDEIESGKWKVERLRFIRGGERFIRKSGSFI